LAKTDPPCSAVSLR